MPFASSLKNELVVRPHPGTGGDQRRERAQPHRLQDLLRDDDLPCPIAARLRRQRDPDGVSDALLEEDPHTGGRRDDRLRAHPCLGQSEMQGMVATGREVGVDGDQVLHRAHLAGQYDVVARMAQSLGLQRAVQRRADQGLAHDRVCVERRRTGRVLVHQPSEQGLIEAAPVHPDAHRAVVLQRLLDHRREPGVALRAEADVAGIDAVLRERLGALANLGEQAVPVVVEVADERPPRSRPRRAARGSRAPPARPPACSRWIRTSSDPARARASTCATVAATSAVSVSVMDWTTMGAPPPTRTGPTGTPTLARRDAE